MRGKFEAPRRKKSIAPILLILIIFAAAILLGVKFFGGTTEEEAMPGVTESHNPTVPEPAQTTAPPETTRPEAAQVVATATVSAQGDLLMHKPVFNTCRQEDGTYDFGSLFQYVAEYTASYDYAVANLETTLGGDDFPYQGNPSFNCPDEIVDAVKAAGYDMLLTANNHSYDTLMTGINRTLEQFGGKGLDTLGTRLSEDEPRYSIVDVNGIKIGMVCYTYTLRTDSDGKPSLNDNSPVESPQQINWFSYQNLNKFYSAMEEIVAAMKADGAEATMLYIHWGKEYATVENDTQRAIAQKMCDLGIDVIVGGHPHVVQPMELLESRVNPDHKTVCIYSLGNAVSNQRREQMNLKTGHTEDGVLFSVAFVKYSDGSVRVSDVDVLPTWVVMYGHVDNPTQYNILPLDKEKETQWQTLYGLTDEAFSECKDSYERTMSIVSPDLNKCLSYLEQFH